MLTSQMRGSNLSREGGFCSSGYGCWLPIIRQGLGLASGAAGWILRDTVVAIPTPGKVDFCTGTGRKAFLRMFLQPDSGLPRYICFYSTKKGKFIGTGHFFSPLHGLLKKGGGYWYTFFFSLRIVKKCQNYFRHFSTFFAQGKKRQQFRRGTSIGSLPPKSLGKSRGPPQSPAEPSERPPQDPRRTL